MPAGALSAANFPATKVGPSSSSTVGCLKQQAMSRDSNPRVLLKFFDFVDEVFSLESEINTERGTLDEGFASVRRAVR